MICKRCSSVAHMLDPRGFCFNCHKTPKQVLPEVAAYPLGCDPEADAEAIEALKGFGELNHAR